MWAFRHDSLCTNRISWRLGYVLTLIAASPAHIGKIRLFIGGILVAKCDEKATEIESFSGLVDTREPSAKKRQKTMTPGTNIRTAMEGVSVLKWRLTRNLPRRPTSAPAFFLSPVWHSRRHFRLPSFLFFFIFPLLFAWIPKVPLADDANEQRKRSRAREQTTKKPKRSTDRRRVSRRRKWVQSSRRTAEFRGWSFRRPYLEVGHVPRSELLAAWRQTTNH